MPILKDCEQCGNPFSVRPAKGHQRFCSAECLAAFRAAKHDVKKCVQCGTLFETTRDRERDRQFCGEPCMRIHQAINGRPAAQVAEIEFSCRQCGKPFFYKPAYLTAYRKKFGKDPIYCSMPCSDLGRRADADAKHTTQCSNCGKLFTKTRRKGSGTIYREQHLCSRQCKNEWVSKIYREKHGLPQITRRIKRGYVELRIPASDGNPVRFMLEHRYVMEQFLGRPLLPTETVHHRRAWDKTCNDMENLELRTGNHGPGGAVEDLVPWCVEMLETYSVFITDELRERLKAVIERDG